MRPYKAYFPRKDAYAKRICRLLVFTASMSVPKRRPKRHPLLFIFFELLSTHGWEHSCSSPLSHFPHFYRLQIGKDFSSLRYSSCFHYSLRSVQGLFLFSQWLTIHHTPGRIRTHTAQILSLLSPAVGLLEQNHHRGSRTPSFWFVAKCFIH